ncbi:hypothetical protein NMY22_g3489 [Coprinellus aureogranulatus]|nr:hypothetical protein NMY22_g3489 [Coprinellus aureogranulatus]
MGDRDRTVRDYVFDSLAEIYAELTEEDLFYGLWRRRYILPDTNIALSFEQVGMWDQASTIHEAAQDKVRNQTLTFDELEYGLWEDHWVLAAGKLQHWDILYEFQKNRKSRAHAREHVKDEGLPQDFQQFVELQEAVQIFGSLLQTNTQNLGKKSAELKMVCPTYTTSTSGAILLPGVRTRSNTINEAYVPLIGGANQPGATGSPNSSTYGFRDYHETA